MILNENMNMPVSSPECADMALLLSKFQVFLNDPNAGMQKLVAFIRTPSAMRELFFRETGLNYKGKSNRYILISIQ